MSVCGQTFSVTREEGCSVTNRVKKNRTGLRKKTQFLMNLKKEIREIRIFTSGKKGKSIIKYNWEGGRELKSV